MTVCEHDDDPNICPPCNGPAPAPAPPVAHCRSCSAPIVWTVTSKGKRMPVDAEPGFAGKFKVVPSDDGEWQAAYDPGPACIPDRHTSHFSTCDRPNEWRKK